LVVPAGSIVSSRLAASYVIAVVELIDSALVVTLPNAS
jgi:hypothetical protein